MCVPTKLPLTMPRISPANLGDGVKLGLTIDHTFLVSDVAPGIALRIKLDFTTAVAGDLIYSRMNVSSG
jgi:hypothetical protein